MAQIPTSGLPHKQTAGDEDDQVFHRRYCEGQAAGEEGVIARVGE